MPRNIRRRLYWPYCLYWGWHHFYGPYGPPLPPRCIRRPTPKEEIENLKEHIEMLKEELKATDEELKEMEKSK